MREPFVLNRLNFLKSLHEASPVGKEDFKKAVKEFKIQPYFLAAMRRQHIIKETSESVSWEVGEPNSALCDSLVAMEEELIRNKKGGTISGKRINPIARYSDQVLLEELKLRGYEGTLYRKTEYTL